MYFLEREGLGEQSSREPWRVRLGLRAKPQYLRFLSLDHFKWNEPSPTALLRDSLTPRLREMIGRLAEHVRVSWKSMQPIGFIRLVGHTDNTGREQYNLALGDRRAQAVKEELESLLREDIISGRTRIAILVEPSPGAADPIAVNSTSEGRARNRRVDVFITPPEPPQPPPPPPIVLRPTGPPLPEPETPEQRIQRILRTLPPAPPPRRPLTQVFWQRLDEQLDAAMSRLNVPRSLRGHIRDGAHAAISRGSEALLNQIVDATDLPSGVQDAIRNTVRASLQAPIR